jgi:hypothetical protein
VELPPLLPSRLRALRVKTQALASAGASDGGGLVASLLGGVVFGVHDLHSAMVVCLPGCVSLPSVLEDAEAAASGRWLCAGAAAPEGGAATSLWCGDAACHSLGGGPGRVGGRAVGSVGRVLERTVGRYVGAAATTRNVLTCDIFSMTLGKIVMII